MWFLLEMEPDSPAYNIPSAFRIRGPLVVEQISGLIARRIECWRKPGDEVKLKVLRDGKTIEATVKVEAYAPRAFAYSFGLPGGPEQLAELEMLVPRGPMPPLSADIELTLTMAPPWPRRFLPSSPAPSSATRTSSAAWPTTTS